MAEKNVSHYVIVKQAQDKYIDMCTGGVMDAEEYTVLRDSLLSQRDFRSLLPDFVQNCRDLSQFWTLAKDIDSKYQGRRKWLWSEFGPLLDRLEDEVMQIDPINPETLEVVRV